MADPYDKLVPVNFYLRFHGWGEGIHYRRVAFDPWRLRLHVDGSEGLVTFGEDDHFQLEVLDLDVPLYLRLNAPNEGWSSLDIGEFINILQLDFLTF